MRGREGEGSCLGRSIRGMLLAIAIIRGACALPAKGESEKEGFCPDGVDIVGNNLALHRARAPAVLIEEVLLRHRHGAQAHQRVRIAFAEHVAGDQIVTLDQLHLNLRQIPSGRAHRFQQVILILIALQLLQVRPQPVAFFRGVVRPEGFPAAAVGLALRLLLIQGAGGLRLSKLKGAEVARRDVETPQRTGARVAPGDRAHDPLFATKAGPQLTHTRVRRL